mmetsp:Transcript_78822/g.190949  ORF Transcript_78822/g.190949 Transcript_78822/m.190949 type:complete len:291 (-) Transcript_78822:350-1222(-)
MSASCILIACASANATSTLLPNRCDNTNISIVRRPSSASRRSSRSTASAPKSSEPFAFSSSKSNNALPDARSNAVTRSPAIADLFFATDIHTLRPGLNVVATTFGSCAPMSSARQPQYNASMTRVDVTSFSLKNRFTIPFKRTSAFSTAVCAASLPAGEARKSRIAAHLFASSRTLARPSRFSSKNRRQIPSTLVRYTRTSSRRYCGSRHRNGRAGFSWITCTCALITSVSATVNPSITFESSMNFFQPQSCSFLQNRWSVSEYLLFFGSLFTTAIVNCAKWLQPGRSLS